MVAVPDVLAEDALWGTPWDSVIHRPDVTVTLGKNKKSEETREIVFEGGVEVKETRKNGKIETQAFDKGGAVGCAWLIHSHIVKYLSVCDKDNPAKTRMNSAMERINTFILTNSVPPITKEQLETQFQKRPFSPEKCEDKFAEKSVQKIVLMTEEEFNARLDKLLAKPRPPVMNPCL